MLRNNGKPSRKSPAAGAKSKRKASAKASKLRVEYVDIKDIKPDPDNPRRIEPFRREKLRQSIQHFGVVDPLIVERTTRYIIGGNQRYEIIVEEGHQTVPVIFLKLSSQQRRALSMALNSIMGEFDWRKVSRCPHELQDFDESLLTLTGFAEFEIEPLLDAEWQRPAADNTNTNASMDSAPNGSNGETQYLRRENFTPEQLEIIDKAIDKVRTAAQDSHFPFADALTVICGAYLE